MAYGSEPGTGLGHGGREEAPLGGAPGQLGEMARHSPLYPGRRVGGTRAREDSHLQRMEETASAPGIPGEPYSSPRQREPSEADSPPARVPTRSLEPLTWTSLTSFLIPMALAIEVGSRACLSLEWLQCRQERC